MWRYVYYSSFAEMANFKSNCVLGTLSTLRCMLAISSRSTLTLLLCMLLCRRSLGYSALHGAPFFLSKHSLLHASPPASPSTAFVILGAYTSIAVFYSCHLKYDYLGGAGDLARNKIFPALFQLYLLHSLPPSFLLIGYSRRLITEDQFRDEIRAAISSNLSEKSHLKLATFLSFVKYFRTPSYACKASLQDMSRQWLPSFERSVFYLALPPHQFQNVLAALEASPEIHPPDIVIEKPVGKDAHSARAILSRLEKISSSSPAYNNGDGNDNNNKKKSIYLVDHYIGKEVVRNIPHLRFMNHFPLGPNLSHESVAFIEIAFHEKNRLQGRSGYFDEYGIVRDIMSVKSN